MFYWLSDVPSYDGEMEILYIIQSINQFDFAPFAIKRCQITDLSGKFPLALEILNHFPTGLGHV